jgi:hypothetical protein
VTYCAIPEADPRINSLPGITKPQQVKHHHGTWPIPSAFDAVNGVNLRFGSQQQKAVSRATCILGQIVSSSIVWLADLRQFRNSTQFQPPVKLLPDRI